jgi:hypothetical protein
MARRPLREPPKSDEPVPDDLRTVFGQNLRAARVKGGLTQAQLSERTSLTQQYVSWVRSRPREYHSRHNDSKVF